MNMERKIDETHSRFPTPEELAKASVEDLRQKARVGYRDRYIVESAQMISDGMLDMELLRTADIETARKELMKLPGVGPKVCDCILLFAFKRSESFPVDVWIKRVMEELYLGKATPKNKIADEGRRIFGENAGFAQQYLFTMEEKIRLVKYDRSCILTRCHIFISRAYCIACYSI